MSVQAFTWVMEHSEARLAARLTLMSIANHCDSYGENSFPSVGLIAKEAKISDREVQRSLRILVQLGELKIYPGTGPRGAHMYSLPLMRGDKLSPDNLSGVTNTTKWGDKSGGAIRNNRHEPKIKSSSNPRSPLAGGAAAATGVQLTSRDLRNVAKEIREIYEAPSAHLMPEDEVFNLACERFCLNPDEVRAAMGKKHPERVSA